MRRERGGGRVVLDGVEWCGDGGCRKVQAIGGHLLAHETGVTGSPGSILRIDMTDYDGCDGTITLNA